MVRGLGLEAVIADLEVDELADLGGGDRLESGGFDDGELFRLSAWLLLAGRFRVLVEGVRPVIVRGSQTGPNASRR
jgi:hypothetical protein